MMDSDSRWLSQKRVDWKGLEWGSLPGSLQQELPLLGCIGFDHVLSYVTLLNGLSKFAEGSCLLLGQKMADLLNGPPLLNPPSTRRWKRQAERSPLHHFRVGWSPSPPPIPPARLWAAWQEELGITQMLCKCNSMLGLSHGDVKGMAKKKMRSLFNQKHLPFPVTFERFFINTDLMPPLQRFAKSSNKAIYLISLKILRSWWCWVVIT